MLYKIRYKNYSDLMLFSLNQIIFYINLVIVLSLKPFILLYIVTQNRKKLKKK